MTLEYVRRADVDVEPRHVLKDGFFAAFCGIFRTPSIRTSSPSGADAGSHPRRWATELGAVVRRAWIIHARS